MLLMVFTVNHIKFGIPLEEVEFITENIGCIETSFSSGHILGRAVLREEVTLIYSLASRFGFPEETIGNIIIVVGVGAQRVGLNVKEVDGIKYMEEFTFSEIPPIIKKEDLCIKHVIRYRQEIILVLDIKKMIDDMQN